MLSNGQTYRTMYMKPTPAHPSPKAAALTLKQCPSIKSPRTMLISDAARLHDNGTGVETPPPWPHQRHVHQYRPQTNISLCWCISAQCPMLTCRYGSCRHALLPTVSLPRALLESWPGEAQSPACLLHSTAGRAHTVPCLPFRAPIIRSAAGLIGASPSLGHAASSCPVVLCRGYWLQLASRILLPLLLPTLLLSLRLLFSLCNC
jgi:hypothetical protein